MRVGELAAIFLLIASRAARIRIPSAQEAALMAIVVKLEKPAANPTEAVQRERRWRSRLNMARQRAREALLAYPLGLRNTLIFEDGRLTPRKGPRN
jgi:hypothetical protein